MYGPLGPRDGTSGLGCRSRSTFAPSPGCVRGLGVDPASRPPGCGRLRLDGGPFFRRHGSLPWLLGVRSASLSEGALSASLGTLEHPCAGGIDMPVHPQRRGAARPRGADANGPAHEGHLHARWTRGHQRRPQSWVISLRMSWVNVMHGPPTRRAARSGVRLAAEAHGCRIEARVAVAGYSEARAVPDPGPDVSGRRPSRHGRPLRFAPVGVRIRGSG